MKLIYDNIHGYIRVDDHEQRIIDAPIFQRLRKISNLGLAEYVYPGATHTRFAHSLGTLYVMDRVARQLIDEGVLKESDKKILRIVALLHDIGHYPFSHVLQDTMKEKFREETVDHELIATILIDKCDEIRKQIECITTAEEVKSILQRTNVDKPLYSYLMSSSLDVDKIDYLQRDSIHSGAPYGRIDIDRLISTITVDNIDHPSYLVIREKGKQAIENFLIARYHMFQTLYFHKTVAAFELMLNKICFELIGTTLPTWNEIKKMSIEDFRDYDDHSVWQQIKQSSKGKGITSELSRMLINRTPLKLAHEITQLSEHAPNGIIDSLMEEEDIAQHISNKTDVPSDSIFYLKMPEISFISDDLEQTVWLKSDDNCYEIVKDKNSIIYHLWASKYRTIRIYTTNNNYKEKINHHFAKTLKSKLV